MDAFFEIKSGRLSPLATLAIPTIQASLTPVHDHHGLGVALVAHAGRGREAGAVAGDFDVLDVVGGAVGDEGGSRCRSDPSPALPFVARKGGGNSVAALGAAGIYVSVFF